MRDRDRRDQALEIVEAVLHRATDLNCWSATMVAEVILASLAPARVAAGIVGPCVYCGDERAATVDHVVPVSVGGTDEPDNLVSCCGPCNRLKFDLAVEQFRATYPFGSDKDRNTAHQQEWLRLYRGELDDASIPMEEWATRWADLRARSLAAFASKQAVRSQSQSPG